MKYTMGIDVGVGSLGIAIIDNKNSKIINGVSLIFPTSKSKEERRLFRGQRTQIQRKSKRLDRLRKYLSETLKVSIESDRTDKYKNEIGKGQKQPKQLISPNSVVKLRSKGLRQKLTNEELFRAIMHIARNRGLRLNVGKSDEQKLESKEFKKVANEFCSDIGENKTYKTIGDKLAYLESQEESSIKMRKNINGKLSIFYSRNKVEEELKIFLNCQNQFNPVLTAEIIQKLLDDVFWEKEVDKEKIKNSIGNCCYNIHPLRVDEYSDDVDVSATARRVLLKIMYDEYYDDVDVSATLSSIKYEKRLPIHHPIFQEKRLYEQLNNIHIRHNGVLRNNTGLLDINERNKLYEYTKNREETTAKQIKKKLGIDTPEYSISLESSYSRKKKKITTKKTENKTPKKKVEDRVIKGNKLLVQLNKTLLNQLWESLDNDIIEECLKYWNNDDWEKSEFFFSKLLEKNNIKFKNEYIEKICDITLENGYSSAGITATKWLLEEHKKNVIDNDTAEKNIGLTHRTSATGEIYDRLPYYGVILETYCVGGTYSPEDNLIQRYGEIPNSVVSSALNKIRKTTNLFIKEYGRPENINIELSREMSKSQKERDEIQKDINNNQKKNRAYDDIIRANGKEPSRKYYRALKLHEWQNHICPYTGETINIDNIFDGTTALDHILPREDTHDDSLSNLVLCLKQANDDKGKKPPYEAFGGGYNYNGKNITYDEILKRIEESPESKKWRFNADAMDKFKEKNPMQKRYETDTAYLARVAKGYLGCLWAEQHKPIRVLTGGITKELRHNWGVHNILCADSKDKKDRSDNRHHLLDAIVIACATQSEIQKLHDYNANKKWWDVEQIRKAIQNQKSFNELDSETQAKIKNQKEYDKILNSENNSYLDEKIKKIVKNKDCIICPWDNFRNDVEEFLNNPQLVKHSERVNNKQGELHRQTPYRVLVDIHKKIGQGDKKGTLELEKTLVSAKSPLYDLATMSGITNSMSDDNVIEKIKKHILDDKTIKNIKSKLNIEKLDLLKVPKDTEKDNYKKIEILNIRRDLESVISMRDKIIDIFKNNTAKTKIDENTQTRDNPAEKKEVNTTPKERLKEAVDKYIKETKQRRYSSYRFITKREIENKRLKKEYKSNAPLRPSRVYETSSNSHMDIFKKADGSLGWQCIAKIDAAAKGYTPEWKTETPDAELVMSFKNGDEFIMWDNKKQKDIFVFLLKMSDGDISFYPVEVSDTADKIKINGEKIKNPNRIRIRSLEDFKNRQIRKIRRDEIGKIICKSKTLE